MFFAAAEPQSFFDNAMPYMVMAIGLVSAALFVLYFASETDRRKRLTGTVLSLLLAGFSVYCIVEGEGVKRGIDLKGGASFLVRVQPAEGRPVTADALNQAQEIIENRLNPMGSKDVTVTKQGEDRLYVEVPGLSDKEIAASKQTIQRVAKLEFRLVSEQNQVRSPVPTKTGAPAYEAQPNPPGVDAVLPGYALLPYERSFSGDREKDKADPSSKPEETIYVKNRAEMGGKSVKEAWPQMSQNLVDYEIGVKLHSAFGDQMEALTEQNIGRPMAIVLDGRVISAPTTQGIFGDEFQITGHFTEEEARELSGALMNPLEYPLSVEQASTISPTYGEATVKQGLRSAVVGLALTLLFMMVYYRMSGIIAVTGLVINLLLLLGAMRVFDQTLTMPGIAGIILTLGMAIDANVLIYERMREEFQTGKSFSSAINAAYEKAFSAIFDSNITTLITSIIMIVIATGAIRGFGLALTIGLIASMFSALLITRVCFLWLSGWGVKRLSFLHLIQNRLYDFMGSRRKWLTLSGIICAACIGIVIWKGEKALGYELRGGSALHFSNDRSIKLEDAENSLKDWTFTSKDGTKYDHTNVSASVVKPLGEQEYVFIRSNPGTADSIKAELAKDIPAKAEAIVAASAEEMGSAVGSEMFTKSLWALGLGLVGIFIYLTFRFEMPFAIGGLVAIFHDVIVAVGVCALFGKEIGLILIGAFLTIAGYSINDTIVIFDRVRENLRTMRGDLEEILNKSISDTLSRTVITSGVTALAVIAMLLFGGKSMADFSFAMLVGMLSGVYSTIFIASPVVLWWAKRRKLNLRQQILDADAARIEALSGIEREAPEKPAKPGEGDGKGPVPA